MTLQEYVKTVEELNQVKLQLLEKNFDSKLKKLKSVTIKEKTYRKLSDIEIILSKIECHTNEQIKLQRFMAKMMYVLVQLHPTAKFIDHEKVVDKYWQEFLRIVD